MTSTWGPTADLIDALDAAGFGGGSANREEQERARAAFVAQAKVQTVTMPDGKTATRTTKTPARWAVAVHVPNDELEPAHWEIFRWVVSSRFKLNEAMARAREIYREVETLDVEVTK